MKHMLRGVIASTKAIWRGVQRFLSTTSPMSLVKADGVYTHGKLYFSTVQNFLSRNDTNWSSLRPRQITE